MHEMSLAMNVMDIVGEHFRRSGAKMVLEVALEVGELSGVDPDALAFALDVCARDGVLKGAKQHIMVIEGLGRCPACKKDFAMKQVFDPCPQCGTFGAEILKGKEMRVKEIVVGE